MYKLEVYQDKAGEWRWRFRWNNEIMAVSSEGYKTKFGAKRALRMLWFKMLFTGVEEVQ